MRDIVLHVVGRFSNHFNNGIKQLNDNVELSTWTYNDLMAFVGMDYAVAA